MQIFVALDLDPAQRDRLAEIAGDDAVHHHGTPDDAAAAPAALSLAEVALGNLPGGWLPAAPALRWMQLESVGFGEYAGLADRPVDLAFTNLAGFFDEPVAESVLAGLLALARGIDTLALLKARGEWQGDGLRPRLRTLAGARVVLFGHGGIGRRVEALLTPFGCTVTAFARDWRPETLDAALCAADIVVAAAPDTPATRGVFDARRLALLPRGALFANFGRGSLVDEAALADALAAGRLGGAVIDVTVEEPLPSAHPFWSAPNLILTQHTGGGSHDEMDRKVALFAANLARYRRGEPLAGLVDFARGY